MGLRLKYDAFRRRMDRETLERIKRWPSMKERFPYVRLYSAEWDAWWRGTGQGYTDDMQASDVMTIQDAIKRAGHCGPEKRIQFVEATPLTEQEADNEPA